MRNYATTSTHQRQTQLCVLQRIAPREVMNARIQGVYPHVVSTLEHALGRSLPTVHHPCNMPPGPEHSGHTIAVSSHRLASTPESANAGQAAEVADPPWHPARGTTNTPCYLLTPTSHLQPERTMQCDVIVQYLGCDCARRSKTVRFCG